MEIFIAIVLSIAAFATGISTGDGEWLSGGEARGTTPSVFNRTELAKGTRVEMEHVRGGRYSRSKQQGVAQEIAMDHLAEDPDYYKKLATIHKD